MGNKKSNSPRSKEESQSKRVEQELQARLRQQAVVVELGQRAMTIPDLQSLMDETVHLVSETLEVEYCKVLELLPGDRELRLLAGVGWQPGLVGNATVSSEQGSQAGFTLLSGEPVIVTDLRQESRFSGPPLLIDHGVVSGLSVLIPGTTRPFGVLGAHSTLRRNFTQDDGNFLQSVANLLGSAIVRVHAERALRRSRDQLAIILQGVADGITVQDPFGKLVYANTAAAKIVGYPSAEAFLNAPLSDVMQKFELLDESGQPFPIERLPGRLALSGEAEASGLIRFRVKATGEEHWSLVKATPVLSQAGQVEMAVNIFQDVTGLKHAEATQRILAESGQLFNASLDYESTLASVANLVVPHLADWCIVHIVEENDGVRQLAVAHNDPKKVELALELQRRYPPDWEAPTGVGNVLRTGQPEFYPEIPEEMLEQSARDAEHYRLIRELGIKAALLLPLVARGRTLGALTLVWSESSRRSTTADISLAEELARRAALAIDNARLYQESQAMNAELEARVSRRTIQLQSIIAKLRDEIAERRKVEEALRKSETLLQSLFDSAPDATVLVNQKGVIEDVNSQVEALFGYPRAEIIGKVVDILLPTRYQQRHIADRTNYLADPRTRPMGAGLELFGRRKDGSEFPVEIMLSPVQAGDEMLVISAVRDITARKQIEADLSEVQRRLIDSGEAERTHLAQELHDGPIQDLYAISYQLKSLDSQAGEDPGLASAGESLQHVIAQLRSICGELRPPALAPFGLEKAILAHLEQTRESNPDLKIDFSLTPDGQNLPEQTRLALFRIYQHSVSNVLRHARANQLQVNFFYDDKQATLEIQDNGCGFEMPARWVELARQGHLGLIGTVERAEAIGGQLEIVSTPGHGTQIRVTVPLAQEPGGVYIRRLYPLGTT
jgi:PAS domain S-box-containing protein